MYRSSVFCIYQCRTLDLGIPTSSLLWELLFSCQARCTFGVCNRCSQSDFRAIWLMIFQKWGLRSTKYKWCKSMMGLNRLCKLRRRRARMMRYQSILQFKDHQRDLFWNRWELMLGIQYTTWLQWIQTRPTISFLSTPGRFLEILFCISWRWYLQFSNHTICRDLIHDEFNVKCCSAWWLQSNRAYIHKWHWNTLPRSHCSIWRCK